MQDQNQEIVFIVAIGGVIGLLLAGFIVTTLFLYQRRQHKQEKEIIRIREEYDQELLRSQLEIQESTFKEIAQELHDNIGMQLTLLKHSFLDIMGKTSGAVNESALTGGNIVKRISNDLRVLSKKLHADRIAHVGLLESIQFEIENIEKATKGLKVEYTAVTKTNFFSDQASVFIYRIFQEMFNNIIKHAKATLVNVNVLIEEGDIFVLQLVDNGVGFSMEDKYKNPATMGVGMKSIKNRASLIGATINIDSVIGKGTTVSLSLPIPKEDTVKANNNGQNNSGSISR
jgi:signal transduction histidine kinase